MPSVSTRRLDFEDFPLFKVKLSSELELGRTWNSWTGPRAMSRRFRSGKCYAGQVALCTDQGAGCLLHFLHNFQHNLCPPSFHARKGWKGETDNTRLRPITGCALRPQPNQYLQSATLHHLRPVWVKSGPTELYHPIVEMHHARWTNQRGSRNGIAYDPWH
ncbi:hypothetical protein VUR80DRAFT_1576 [Thermomyces stellatus]